MAAKKLISMRRGILRSPSKNNPSSCSRTTINSFRLPTAKLKRIAVIGSHADVAVMSGGGSADTMHPVTGSFPGCEGLEFVDHNGCGWWRNPWLKIPVPLMNAIREVTPASEVEFSGVRDEQVPFRAYSPGEIADAVALARKSDVAIVVVAQPAGEDFGDLKTLQFAEPFESERTGRCCRGRQPAYDRRNRKW